MMSTLFWAFLKLLALPGMWFPYALRFFGLMREDGAESDYIWFYFESLIAGLIVWTLIGCGVVWLIHHVRFV